MSLLAARGDGARLCPPKAQPSPPPRDLVQRSANVKFQVSQSQPRVLPYMERRACELLACRSPKLLNRSGSQAPPRRLKLPHSYAAMDVSTGGPGRPLWLADQNNSFDQGTFGAPDPSTATTIASVRSIPIPAMGKSERTRLSGS